METDLLRCVVALAIASTLSILIILAIRRVVRRVFGAAASYSTWLLVPAAMLAVLLPIRRSPGSTLRVSVPIDSAAALRHSLGLSLHTARSVDWTLWALGAWLVGAVLFALYLVGLQRAFVNGLGTLSGSRRVLRAECPEGCPVLLGVLRPKVILPADFESRYTRLERLLVFSHERTHLRRGDALWNALVALMRCLLWFNPFVHLASSVFREDQELACDAAVVDRYPSSRRTYATAMLKTQLAGRALPVGCHWHSAHHLKERLRMLKKSGPSRRRRTCGYLLVAVSSLLVGYAAWATEPSAPLSIALQVRWLVNGAEILNVGAAAQGHRLLVSAGQPFNLSAAAAGTTYHSRCVVKPIGSDQVLIECKVSRNGQVVFTPSGITHDGERGAFRIADPDLDFTMEFTPSIQQ